MLHTSEHPRPIPFVGDNLDRLLALLEAARVEQTGREPRGYRALAAAIASDAPRATRIGRPTRGRRPSGLSLAS